MKSLQVGGNELWYADHGIGAPLVLVHGFPLDHTMWTGQIDGLAGQSFQLNASASSPAPGRAGELLVGEAFWTARETTDKPVDSPSEPALRIIAPDLRGFGCSRAQGKNESTASSSSNDKVTMAQFADDLASLLDGLGINRPVILCGLSMGGYVAFQFWRRHADRLRGLILCDTRATADTPEAAAARLAMAERVLRKGPAPLVESMMPRLFAETTARRQPQVVEGLRRVMMANDPRGIAATARGMAERPDMTPMLGQIRCPTLAIVGQNDAISPPDEMCGIARAIPGAKFVEIPAVGHMAPLEDPATVNAAMREFILTL